jgi:predicted XRE-type DNA-binding protein
MYSTHSPRKHKRRPNTTSRLAGNVIKRSNKPADRRDDEGGERQISYGSDNVFEDLGFEAEEAANLKVRADLMLDLRQYIQAQGWTQAEAATFFGETQPRISNLLKGEISRFSIDKLINMLARAGIQVRVETKLKAA